MTRLQPASPFPGVGLLMHLFLPRGLFPGCRHSKLRNHAVSTRHGVQCPSGVLPNGYPTGHAIPAMLSSEGTVAVWLSSCHWLLRVGDAKWTKTAEGQWVLSGKSGAAWDHWRYDSFPWPLLEGQEPSGHEF